MACLPLGITVSLRGTAFRLQRSATYCVTRDANVTIGLGDEGSRISRVRRLFGLTQGELLTEKSTVWKDKVCSIFLYNWWSTSSTKVPKRIGRAKSSKLTLVRAGASRTGMSIHKANSLRTSNRFHAQI